MANKKSAGITTDNIPSRDVICDSLITCRFISRNLWLDYRYHCQNTENGLLFRYDNTPHFPTLSSFPHHKHLPDDVIVSVKPTIFQVIKESELLTNLD